MIKSSGFILTFKQDFNPSHIKRWIYLRVSQKCLSYINFNSTDLFEFFNVRIGKEFDLLQTSEFYE